MPIEVYANTAASTSSADITGSGGQPAIYRGYYINASDAHIPISLVLNHTWSIHAWILIMTAATSGEANTVFSKDKYSYTGTKNNENLLRLGVNETRNLRVEWARDKSHGF